MKSNFSKDEIRQLVKSNYSVTEMANKFGTDIKEFEEFYIHCFNENRYDFPLQNLLTREWLEEKLQNNTSIISISKYTGASPTAIHRLMNKYGIKKPKINKVLSPETLYALYIEQGLSAAAIAEKYQCSVDSVKKLACNYKLRAGERNKLTPTLEPDFFLKLYVTYGFTLTQIAEMLGCATFYLRYTLLKEMIDNGTIPEQDLRKSKTSVPYYYIINLLFDKVEPFVLFEQLHSHTITSVAEMYGIIPKTGYELYTKEWLQHLMMQMTLTEISDKFHTSYIYIAALKKEYGLSHIHAEDKLDEVLVNKLFIDNGWSNEEIATALDTSVYSVIQFRKKHGIKRKNNRTLKDKLPQSDFERLYLDEGLTLKQLSELYGTSTAKISELRAKYGEKNPAILTCKPRGVSEQRLKFLKKEIKFKGLK